MANTIEEILKNKYKNNEKNKKNVKVSIHIKEKHINYSQCMQNMCKTCRKKQICEREK